jgi:hypothetical protein
MADIFAPPAELGPVPEITAFIDATDGYNHDAYMKAEAAFVENVKEWAKEQGSGKYAGEEVSFPVADGAARYVILSLRPVQLIHLPVGDAWQYHLVRHLPASALRELADQQRGFREIFANKK